MTSFTVRWVISVPIIARENIIGKGTENIDILILKALDEIDGADKGSVMCSWSYYISYSYNST